MILTHYKSAEWIKQYALRRFGSDWTADYIAAMTETWWDKSHRPNRQAAIDEWRRMTKVRSAQHKAIDRAASLTLTPECIEAILDARQYAFSLRMPILEGQTYLNNIPDGILSCYASVWASALAIEWFTDSSCLVMHGAITHAVDPAVCIAAGECDQDSNPLTLPIPMAEGFVPVPLSRAHAAMLLDDYDEHKKFPKALYPEIVKDISEKVAGMTNISMLRAQALTCHALDQHGITCCMFNHSLYAKKDDKEVSYPMPIIVVGGEARGDGYMLDVQADITTATQPRTRAEVHNPVILSSDLSVTAESATLFALSMTQTPMLLSCLGFDVQWLGLMPLLASFRSTLWTDLKEGVAA